MWSLVRAACSDAAMAADTRPLKVTMTEPDLPPLVAGKLQAVAAAEFVTVGGPTWRTRATPIWAGVTREQAELAALWPAGRVVVVAPPEEVPEQAASINGKATRRLIRIV